MTAISERYVSQPSARASAFTDPAFARLADLAHLLAGLVFPPNRQPSAEAGMRRAMRTLRISDPAALLRATETPGEARDVVLAELTVGESYFFRHAAQLELLATEILPARVESYGVHRPLRVWSAGCASGEEPYSVAIMLRELGWPHPANILGSDVATARLDVARRGRYTRWALRGVSEERVARWFHRRGNYYDLDREVRGSVQLRTLNLVHDDIASAEPVEGGYDLVLCRNVMIYFDLPTVTAIATRLLDSLGHDGWLVLGASDPPLAHLVPCEAVMTPAGVAYRRPGRPGAAPRYVVRTGTEAPRAPAVYAPPAPDSGRQAPTAAPIVSARHEVPVAPPVVPRDVRANAEMFNAYERADYGAAETLAIVALASMAEGRDDVGAWTVYVRAVANQGRLHEAGELCARALEKHSLSAELHCLHATLLAAADWHADAAIAARRAIYLDRKLVMGHLLLGDALTRTGDAKGARLAFENVLSLLADADPTVPIAAADGVHSTRLRQIATIRLGDVTAEARR